MCRFILDYNSMYLGGFLPFGASGNMNEYFADELQNLQLCLDCVFALPGKTKNRCFWSSSVLCLERSGPAHYWHCYWSVVTLADSMFQDNIVSTVYKYTFHVTHGVLFTVK